MIALSSRLKMPHLLTNVNGRLISSNDAKSVINLKPVDIKSDRGQVEAKIYCSPSDLKALLESIGPRTGEWTQSILTRPKAEDRVTTDLASLLMASADETIDVPTLLTMACDSIRARTLAQQVRIYCTKDDRITLLLAAENSGSTPTASSPHPGHWTSWRLNIIGAVMDDRLPYWGPHPKSISPVVSLQTRESQAPSQIIAAPIISEGHAIGVIWIECDPGSTTQLTSDHVRTSALFAAAVAQVIRVDSEQKRSERMLATSANLGKYLSHSVVRQIATRGTSGALGGEERKVVVLFADIRGFTTITDGVAAPDLVELLNFYFEEMSAVVERFGGTVDKLVGDLMMVLWNVPTEQREPEVLALKCALEMQKIAALRVQPHWADRGVNRFGIGIGIHSGHAVVGNLGSSRFRNYTVIGKIINLAQRIESKAPAGEVWIHEAMMPLVEGKVPQPIRREYGLRLKGYSTPVTAYVFRTSV